ncbi:MAG: Gfo/Idh/MocA family oxidoreductase [Acidobacteriota bacterium]
MNPLGVLLIGPGWVAGQHIVSYLKNPATEIRAIAGHHPQDKDRAQVYMESHGFACPYYDDWESALQRDDIDLISICASNNQHYRMSLAALEAGKHVLVEKPLCLSSSQLSKLLRAAGGASVHTHVGHVARYYPLLQRLWTFVRNGGIGDVFYCESDYWHEIKGPWKVATRTAGGSLLMGGCHSVDAVLWMVGDERKVEEVFAYTAKPRLRMDFEYDPTVSILMKFDDGTIGRVSSSLECQMPYVFHLQVNGTAGTIRNNGIFSRHFKNPKGFMRMHSDYPSGPDVQSHPFRREIDDFVSCIVKNRESQLSFRRAAPVYEVIFAAERSAREGTPIHL